MKEGKHTKRNFKKIEAYSVLILIATLFMSIGYAKISDISSSISGTVEAISQEGVFITDITNQSNVNADMANSKINYFTGTMVESEIVLGDTTDSSITYQVEFYNNSDEEYVFIGVITDKSDLTLYSNENIEFTLSEIEEYATTISPKESLTFTITFKYIDEADISNKTLMSKLNFRFKEIPIIVFSNEIDTISDIYPDYISQEEYEFTVSNYIETENNTLKINTVPVTYYLETATIEDSPLIAKIYDESGDEVTDGISMEGDGQTQTTHTYTLKIIWDNSNPVEGTAYNSSEYANKEFMCNITLKAIPGDEKYNEYKLEKQSDVGIKTAQFYFNANPETQDISIKSDESTLAMTINNYNSDTEYNVFDTTYEISIEGNDEFTFSINDEEPVNNVITKTVSGGSKIDDSFDIKLMADMSNLEITESLKLKIISKSPYVAETEITINIILHTVKVTLNANGGTVSPSTITVYQSKTYADLPTPTYSGHTFNGWYSAKTGGTKYTTTTEVTTSSSTQTLYAQWTSRLLADKVSVGDYVNYPVSYENVYTNPNNNHIADDNTYTGWRVLSIDGSGDNKYVRLVSAGVPLSYKHPNTTSDTSAGATSVKNLTTNFFSTGISTTLTDNKFYLCGFKNSSGGSITTISQLKTLFTNDYTQTSSSVPKVQSMTKEDLELVLGSTAQNETDVRSNDLLAIPAEDQTSKYAAYYLATSAYNYYVWDVYYSGYVVYTYGTNGVRPVVTLKTTVETTGKTDSVWQLK